MSYRTSKTQSRPPTRKLREKLFKCCDRSTTNRVQIDSGFDLLPKCNCISQTRSHKTRREKYKLHCFGIFPIFETLNLERISSNGPSNAVLKWLTIYACIKQLRRPSKEKFCKFPKSLLNERPSQLALEEKGKLHICKEPWT